MDSDYASLITRCANLSELREIIYMTKEKYFPLDDLHPVPGDGKAPYPIIMGIFINPTARNVSAHSEWSGPRYPFVGIRSFWRVFHRAGILDTAIMESIEGSRLWDGDLATLVLGALNKAGVYLTNLVKRAYHGPQLPDQRVVQVFLPLLLKEIELVHPQCIVTFGRFTFFQLTRKGIKLDEYYHAIDEKGSLECFTLTANSRSYRVIPCYFPVGRGDPVRAARILGRLWNSIKE
ncbi:MAG: uracil-DNA glycosylase family protein [Syntrophorhabdus sp.]